MDGPGPSRSLPPAARAACLAALAFTTRAHLAALALAALAPGLRPQPNTAEDPPLASLTPGLRPHPRGAVRSLRSLTPPRGVTMESERSDRVRHSMRSNRRSAEAMSLETFDHLPSPQQQAVLGAHDNPGGPELLVSTRSSTRRALETAELVEPGSRSFTPWGAFVYRVARARHRERIESKAAAHAGRGNRSSRSRLEAA
jgi:hypothetical protein